MGAASWRCENPEVPVYEVRDGVDAEGDGRLIAFHLLLEAIIRNTGDPHGLFLLSFR